tara:strand:- start:1912 stop:2775 length:864 start_codon:yes stop_codon:yes gene_type:complete
MIELLNKYNIELFNNKKIIKDTTLSNSFGCCCKKIILDDQKIYVIKFTLEKKIKYPALFYEAKSIEFMYKKFPDLFPRIYFKNKNIIILEYIKNNGKKNDDYEKELALKISQIHKVNNEKFGFNFDTPIGGLRQISDFNHSWVEFYGNNRLGMIFNEINKTEPMPKEINIGIEKILKNLKNLIPNHPTPSLIHGDLWEGNILYNDGKLVALIDPGIHFAHNEMEISYLKWFKFISNSFYDYYSEFIKIDKNFFNYSEIYELYYSLLNVHLWSREYIKDTAKLVKKFN